MPAKRIDIIGKAYEEPVKRIKQFAKMNLPVLIVGETGVGKELFASLYQETSPRKGEKMPINCAAYEDSLLRSAIFGHVKGAFTDAKTKRSGLLKTCDEGVLFLDELGDASPQFQTSILRVLEEETFYPMGSDKVESVRVTFIAATNNAAKIREDLKYRFHLLPIPPLQRGDIPALAEFFLKRPVKAEILGELISRKYDGNVRELKKECERIHLDRGDSIFTSQEPLLKEDVLFDYSRFEREFLTWNKYMEPIMARHDLNFRYQYLSKSLTGAQGKDLRGKLSEKVDPIITAIRTGGSDRNEIVRSMESKYLLPYLLQEIYVTFDNPQPVPTKPDLSRLLDLPPRKATRDFQLVYFDYHLRTHSHDKQETARELNMHVETLKTKIKRLKNSEEQF